MSEFPKSVMGDMLGFGDAYPEHEVNEWINECMEDFPIYPVLNRGHPWTHREYNAWFKKWFSQFMKKCEK